MKTILLALAVITTLNVFSQNSDTALNKTLLKELAENACKCIDSIEVTDKKKDQVVEEINHCIDRQVGAYQMGSKLMDIENLKKDAKEVNGKKEINISINYNKDSKEYKKYYFEMERYLMENCTPIKAKVAANDKQHSKSLSSNKDAMDWYAKGLDESKQGNYEKAISYYQKAVKIDPEFAFAWDNMGISYRKLGNYDKALEAYQKSLEVDPTGMMPLQNIPVVYQYKQEYDKAIAAYEKLAEVDKDNPEIFYGIGNIYAVYLQDYEKGLSNMCKAYNMYIAQKSPYRTDAEKVINAIYQEMKKQGKEARFNEILKENNISSQ